MYLTMSIRVMLTPTRHEPLSHHVTMQVHGDMRNQELNYQHNIYIYIPTNIHNIYVYQHTHQHLRKQLILNLLARISSPLKLQVCNYLLIHLHAILSLDFAQPSVPSSYLYLIRYPLITRTVHFYDTTSSSQLLHLLNRNIYVPQQQSCSTYLLSSKYQVCTNKSNSEVDQAYMTGIHQSVNWTARYISGICAQSTIH